MLAEALPAAHMREQARRDRNGCCELMRPRSKGPSREQRALLHRLNKFIMRRKLNDTNTTVTTQQVGVGVVRVWQFELPNG
jgi:hypothetical protein